MARVRDKGCAWCLSETKGHEASPRSGQGEKEGTWKESTLASVDESGQTAKILEQVVSLLNDDKETKVGCLYLRHQEARAVRDEQHCPASVVRSKSCD